ncbi:MAG: hypothetical protein KGM97_01765 [Alphaproteobacteria bacterium]|nr:hypothetical protein [Alphaproteobacteria bacterium]MDE2629692.1 hypothetical protein [Alphaproteobacteria bacterium]
MAGYKQRDNDAFIDEDVGYPNRESQYRGYRYFLRFIFVAAILAVIIGLIEGAEQVFGAFSSFSSLLEGAAWARFFAGLGALTRVGLVALLVAVVLRWWNKRSASRK